MNYYTPREAVRVLHDRGCRHVTEDGLAQMRHRGTGPEYESDGPKYILYSERAIDEWALKRRSIGHWCTKRRGRPAPVGYLKTRSAAIQDEDLGDLIFGEDALDYRDPDPYFDEITKFLAREREELFHCDSAT